MSKTKKNLEAAFAGEAQARNKYLFFAQAARKEGYHYIARIFEEIVQDVKDRQRVEEIQKEADKICVNILNGMYEEVDFKIAQEKLREKCEKYFPGKGHVFTMIYESRFQRLWEQFRKSKDKN